MQLLEFSDLQLALAINLGEKTQHQQIVCSRYMDEAECWWGVALQPE